MSVRAADDGIALASERWARRALGRLAVFALALVASVIVGLSGCSQVTSSYAHFTIHLMHGDEPVTLDWVGECRHKRRGGEMRDYVQVSVVPYVYGVATRDGGMVMAVAPNYCGAGEPRKDYLPLLFWGDKAGDFNFLTAYVSEAAFTNPASRLKVLDVEMRPASTEEHRAWKRDGIPNVVPAKHNPFLRNADGMSDEKRVGCAAFALFPIPASVQVAVDAAWPPDHPAYWPLPYDLETEVFKAFDNGSEFPGIANMTLRFAEGLGAFQQAEPVIMIDFAGRSVPAGLLGVMPIDFDFFHEHRTEYYYNKKSKIYFRPVFIEGHVDDENIGMMYCGFFPDLMDAVDTKYDITFPGGKFTSVQAHHSNMVLNKLFLRYLGFGMDIERGEDGDD